MIRSASFIFIFFCISATANIAEISAPDGEKSVSVLTPGNKVEVYYFHYSRRCATCNAVEDETKHALEKHFKKQMDEGDITFLSVNVEEEGSETLTDLYQISGQTLLFVGGEETINLTDVAFMNARTKPEKFRKLVKETVLKLIK